MARDAKPTRKRAASRSWATFRSASATTAPMSFAPALQFALDWSGGAPPEPYFKDDEFTQKWGQNWGIPLYRWDVMRTNNFDWWRQRVRGVREIFHIFRIDHVLGFYRIYAFPWRPRAKRRNFCRSTGRRCAQRTGGRDSAFCPAGRRDLGKLRGEPARRRRISARRSWKRRARPGWSGRIWERCPTMCGRVCVR